jgi:hypothetical protein
MPTGLLARDFGGSFAKADCRPKLRERYGVTGLVPGGRLTGPARRSMNGQFRFGQPCE